MTIMLNTEQVADLLNVTTTTVRNYRTAGRLEGQPTGRGLRTIYRYDLDAVIAFANEHEIEMNQQALSELTESDRP